MTISPLRVHAAPLPDDSRLHQYFAPGDFLDCYRVACDLEVREAAEIVTAFPGWAQMLVKLRNILVLPFGLRGEGPQSEDMVGIFPVEHETETEVVAGFDDHHLNFRVSVLRAGQHIYLATWVHRNNMLGRIYLAAIMPFHVLIVRDALGRVAHAQKAAPA